MPGCKSAVIEIRGADAKASVDGFHILIVTSIAMKSQRELYWHAKSFPIRHIFRASGKPISHQ